MEAIAKTKYLKGSPRKARLVIDMIRGQNVSRALSILKFTQKRAAQPIAKCLNSAIANATYNAEQQNIAIDPDDLWVKACYVDMGPTKHRRRMRPAPQGRAYREQRHYCHITIEVTSEEKPKTEKELKAEAAKARRAETKKAEPKKAAKKDAAKAPKAKKDEAAAAPAEEKVEAAPAVEETVETAPAAEETVEANAEEVVAEDAAPAAEEAEKTEGETEAETK
ncbi:MAG: 50S ribosomal protein L22 [Acidobacteria bacterium]|nr:50S ribosomal protein L22 [Acidobacteriota bacterium]